MLKSREDNDDSVRWQSGPLDRLSWLTWSDDCIVYHRPSGQTHFLNAASKKLIEDLSCNAATAAEIAEKFGAPDGVEERRVHRQEIKDMLERLEHLGLIDRR